MEACIRESFNPRYFKGRPKGQELDDHIEAFNKYLIPDGWRIVIVNEGYRITILALKTNDNTPRSAANAKSQPFLITLEGNSFMALRDFLLSERRSCCRTDAASAELFDKHGLNNTCPIFGNGIGYWGYIDNKLKQINGTPEMEACIKESFNPRYFKGQSRRQELDYHIGDFNKYLIPDGYKIVDEGYRITILNLKTNDNTPRSAANAKGQP
jgi:hypothetical protein